MKKFITATVAAAVAITGMTAPAFANPGHDNRHDNRQRVEHRTVVKKVVVKPQYRSWSKGQRFDSHYARNYRVISSPRAYRLHDAPRGYRWVQSGNDAVLIGITSGIIAAVMANTIR
jgi:Ni/Co efflux regulator RcnB